MMAIRITDEDKVLEFQDTPNKRLVHVYPTSETGQASSGTRRVSKTWNFEHEGLKYRVQLQITHPEVGL